MKKTTRRKIVAGAIGLLALGIFATTLVFTFVYDPSAEFANPQPAEASTIPADPPQHISIPSVSIDASIETVGLIGNDRMAAPKKFADAAWYENGTAPGQFGSAVIAGHLDNGLGLDGAFKKLSDVQPGDEIDVTTKSGATLRFRVTGSTVYPYDAVPSSIFTEGGGQYLNLITCAGKWMYSNAIGFTYDERLVVSAVEMPGQ